MTRSHYTGGGYTIDCPCCARELEVTFDYTDDGDPTCELEAAPLREQPCAQGAPLGVVDVYERGFVVAELKCDNYEGRGWCGVACEWAQPPASQLCNVTPTDTPCSTVSDRFGRVCVVGYEWVQPDFRRMRFVVGLARCVQR